MTLCPHTPSLFAHITDVILSIILFINLLINLFIILFIMLSFNFTCFLSSGQLVLDIYLISVSV